MPLRSRYVVWFEYLSTDANEETSGSANRFVVALVRCVSRVFDVVLTWLTSASGLRVEEVEFRSVLDAPTGTDPVHVILG